MRVHANLTNPMAQLDAAYAAQRAAGKRAAARTRKKLLESASELSGESASGEPCVGKLEAGEDSQGQAKPENRTNSFPPHAEGEEREARGDQAGTDTSISDWA